MYFQWIYGTLHIYTALRIRSKRKCFGEESKKLLNTSEDAKREKNKRDIRSLIYHR